MRQFIILLCLMLYSVEVVAQAETSISLDKASVNLHDKESIKRGAKFFATTCMVCHTMIYMRYNTLAKEAGVVYERMPVNVTQWPFGIKPPDLSLEVSRRGADWVYTYLHSFYIDPSRPTGANNLLVHNTAMTYILAGFQGRQVKIPDAQLGKLLYHKPEWYDELQQVSPGMDSPEKFDAMVNDLVNFLAYASTPYKLEQEWIGIWVLFFLFILFILVYLLKQSYWHDIKRSGHGSD